jgi:uncharacterized protein
MPTVIDLIIVFAFSVAFLAWEHFVAWPRIRAAITSGDRGARTRAYRTIMIVQWAFAILIAVRCEMAGVRSGALGITMPAGWRLVTAMVLILAAAALFRGQARAIAKIPAEKRAQLRERLKTSIGDARLILPRTSSEGRWFAALAVTAGCCEEFLYRGYAVWALRAWLGLWGAAAISVVLFGLGHSYQGRRGAVRSTVVGAVLTLVVLITGSILPAVVLHAIVDLGGGAAGRALFADEGESAVVRPEIRAA